MARHDAHHGEIERAALLAGAAGLAWWGWKKGWFAHLAPGASHPPAASGSPPAQLLPPTQLAPTPAVTYLPAPYSPPQTYVVQPSPATVGAQLGPPTYYSQGGAFSPSNFAVNYDPKTGLELPYAPPGTLVPAQNLCDSIFPNNDPTGIYQTNIGDHKTYGHMIDALSDDFSWIKQYFTGPTTLQAIADGRTGGAGYNPAGAKNMVTLLSQVLGLAPTAQIDMSLPKNMVAVLRAFVAGHNGLSYFNAVPDQCFIAAYNQTFSPPISSL